MNRQLLGGVLLLVAAILLAACGGTTPVASPQATTPSESPLATPGQVEGTSPESPLATPGQGAITPASEETCSQMATLLQDTLGMQGTTSEASFEDFVRGQTGTGCAVTITGTGADFPNGADANAVIAAMEAAGWTQDNYYAAGGPTANIIGFTKGNELCLYQDTWAPPAGVECPTNTPIGECVEPEQRQYTITLNCATITQ